MSSFVQPTRFTGVRRTRFDDWPCSVARAVDLLADWWTPLVLREAFYGVRRFDDFVAGLGIGRNVLTERLARLTDAGILDKVQYQAKPPRYEYRLTEKGRDLFDVVLAFMRWGDAWLSPDGPPVELRDRITHRPVRPMMVDAHTREPIDPRRVYAVPGPGMPDESRRRAVEAGRFKTPDESA